MLQHALQICTIASVAIAVDADLILAVNMNDFRYIANKFLSKDLVDELTDLVSKVSLTRTEDVRLKANKEEFGKEKKLNNDGRLPNQSSNINLNPNKRFITIKNSNKDLLDSENNLPGLEYVRDELDDILNNKKEYTPNDKPSVFDFTTTLANVNDNIDSKEIQSNTPHRTTSERKDQCDTLKKIDYTDTKLGEWKYTYGESKKPIDIKNVKNGNLDRYTNDQGGRYYVEDKESQVPNEKNVQYVYETRLVPEVKRKDISGISNNHKHGLIYLALTRKQKKKEKVYDTPVDKEDTVDSDTSGTKQKDSPKPHKQPIVPTESNEKPPLRYLNEFSTTKDDRQIFKEPILGNKYEMYHENITPKQDERIKDDKESKKLKIHKLLRDSVEAKEVREQDTSSRHNLESHIKIQQINPSIYKVGVNDTDKKYELGTSINNNNDKGSQNKPVEEREDRIRDRKIHNADYENKYEGDEFNNEDLLLKHKKRYLNLKGSQTSENNREKDQTKGHDHHYFGEDKSETVKSKLKDSLKQSKVVENQSAEGNVKFKKEKYKGKKKLRKKPIEENDMYEKTALVSNIERSGETNNKQHNETSQTGSRVELGSKIHKMKFSLQSNANKGSQKSDGKTDMAYKNTRNRKPQKPIEEDKIYKKIALGSKNTKNKRITEQFKNHDRYDQNSNEEPPIKKEPQKLLENDTFEKYELGHEIYEYKRNQKQKENRDSLKAKNKHNSYQSYKDNKTGHNSERLIQNDKQDKHTEITKKDKKYKEDITVKYNEEVKSEPIKANTESLIDSPVKVGKEITNFTMKRTSAPKRDFYKLSSPNYYKDLPRVVDKYDFNEPLPERDRERDTEDKLKREHATINRKFKLTLPENT